MERYDIAVIGGALNGLAAALALGGRQAVRPLEVAIVDGRDPRGFHDPRASAITAASKRMFEALGVWEAMAPHAEPMGEIVVTDGAGPENRPVLLRFDEAAAPGEPSAFMIENRHAVAALLEAASASPHIVFRTGAAAVRFDFGPGPARLTLADGSAILASLIAAADGRESAARHAAGIGFEGEEYGQSAIVTTVAHELPHEGRAEEHFRTAGPFAILPLPGDRASIVWTEKTEDAGRIAALGDEAFLDELRLRLGEHLGAIRLDGPRHSYPLSRHMAKRFIGERLALIGDAAHVIHPLAGLGFNLGLRDAAALADAVADAVKLGLDPGGGAVLEAYERRRRFDTVSTAFASDGLNRLFSNDNPGLAAVRRAGLGIVNRAGPLKTWFMREAAGDTGDLPRLMRGEPV